MTDMVVMRMSKISKSLQMNSTTLFCGNFARFTLLV